MWCVLHLTCDEDSSQTTSYIFALLNIPPRGVQQHDAMEATVGVMYLSYAL